MRASSVDYWTAWVPRCLVGVRSLGTVDSPLLQVEIETAGTGLGMDLVSGVKRQVAWILGTDQDLAPFYRMVLNDSAVGPLALA